MDDSTSTASFEDLGSLDPSNAKSAKDLGRVKVSPEALTLPGCDGADICYVLRQIEWTGKTTELCRSSEPIAGVLTQNSDESDADVKPVLEIVTIRTGTPPPGMSPPPGMNPPPGMSGRHNHEPKDSFQTERTSMEIHSTYLKDALHAVVGYYPEAHLNGATIKLPAPYRVLVHHRAALACYKVNQPRTHDEVRASTTSKHIDVLLGFLERTLGDAIREEEQRHQAPLPTATFGMLWLLFKPGSVVYAKHNNMWTPFVVSRVDEDIQRPGSAPSMRIICWHITSSASVANQLTRAMFDFWIERFSNEESIGKLPVVPARFFRGADGNTDPAEVAEKQVRLGKRVWELLKTPTYAAYHGELVDKQTRGGAAFCRDDGSYADRGLTGSMTGRVIVDCEGYTRFASTCPTNRRFRSAREPFDYGPDRPQPPLPPWDHLPYFAPRCACRACQGRAPSRRSGDAAADDDHHHHYHDHHHHDANANAELGPFAEFRDLDPRTAAAPPRSELYYLVLSKVVAGFVPGARRWAHFDVERLREIRFDREAFRHLVLDDDVKQTVRALAGRFFAGGGGGTGSGTGGGRSVAPWPSDFVKNKGQGRIFLLHGSPGVGKTCTAECVAELTRRPLLALTSGDLAAHSFMVEENLSYFLRLGERFGAIVLIDEADVYLEARRMSDLDRNGLVSIFLRALEYYRGVLLLTTNRVQSFDAAFTSRIHVTLHYRALTDARRERIWTSGFDRLERDSGGRARAGVAAREYALGAAEVRALRWNGREIRNALQTAVALAEAEAEADGRGGGG
ncbi:hypothetical protein GGR56DRAFT_616456, partial [Xylariaceae sp. FL0804]